MSPLPEFDNPPLIETVLSVQFDPVKTLKTPHLGLIWQAFRESFPNVEEHPELTPSFEQFGTRTNTAQRLRLEFSDSPFGSRVWFLNDLGTELIQIQTDRFVRNWRKNEGDHQYPRYHVLRDRFVKDFNTFNEFITQESWGEIKANQCEVTYVNVIPTGESGELPRHLGQILKLFSANLEFNPPGFEDATVTARYLLTNEEGQPIGRLYLEAVPVVRATDDSPAIRLSLTARGRPSSAGLDGMLQFFDVAHEAIVQYFTSLTTGQLHQNWERRQ